MTASTMLVIIIGVSVFTFPGSLAEAQFRPPVPDPTIRPNARAVVLVCTDTFAQFDRNQVARKSLESVT